MWAVADPQGGGTVHGGKRIAAMLKGVSGCSRVLSLQSILTYIVSIIVQLLHLLKVEVVHVYFVCPCGRISS